MSTNMLKKRLKAGKACVNAWLAIPSGFSAETMAQCGWDSVTVDMQHGVQDYHSMVACFQAMDKHPVTPLVRVPWNEPGIIGKVLDGGAWGVICPMINTEAEAKALVSYSLYPPKGKRSNGPIRAGAYGEATPYQATANDEVLVIPMIETQEAIDNIDAILDVPALATSACRSAWCRSSTARSRRSWRSTTSFWPPSRSATSSPAYTTEPRATPPK